jgi:cytochrome c biogenesis protein CcmG, thiol:disulfide interchange protein DsbE
MSDNVRDDELFDEPEPGLPGEVDLLEPTAPAVRIAPQPGGRERIRKSPLGTLLVLLVTAAVVTAGVMLVQKGSAQDKAAQTGGATVITLPGLSKVPPPEVGKPAQDFTVTGSDGARLSLSQFRGKPIWLTFGASWCTGCQAEVPDIEAAYQKFRPEGLVVLGINITEDNAAVKTFAQRVGLTYPMAADPESAIADEYAVSAIPAHYFIDANGIVRDIRIGALAPGVMEGILSKLVNP